MKELDELIKLAKQVAKPYFVLSCILAFLLLVSVCGNIYLATLETEISFEVDDSTDVLQNNES